MSATGRKKKSDGKATARMPLDSYPTAKWVTRVLVDHLGFPLRDKSVLECAAGDGAIVDVLASEGANVDAIELDEGRAETVRQSLSARSVTCADFLTHDFGKARWDAVISNTPYGERVPVLGENGKPVLVMKDGGKRPTLRYRDLAIEFAEKALTLAPVVAFLLRLNWAGSASRVAFHQAHPADLIVLANRPHFRKGSGSDATEYAWWIWREDQTIGTYRVVLSTEAPGRGRTKMGDSRIGTARRSMIAGVGAISPRPNDHSVAPPTNTMVGSRSASSLAGGPLGQRPSTRTRPTRGEDTLGDHHGDDARRLGRLQP